MRPILSLFAFLVFFSSSSAQQDSSHLDEKGLHTQLLTLIADRYSHDIHMDDPRSKCLVIGIQPMVFGDLHQFAGLGSRLDVIYTAPSSFRMQAQGDFSVLDIASLSFDKSDARSGDYSPTLKFAGTLSWLFQDNIHKSTQTLHVTDHFHDNGSISQKNAKIPLQSRAMSGLRLGYWHHQGTLNAKATNSDRLRGIQSPADEYFEDAWVNYRYQGFVLGLEVLIKEVYSVTAEWSNDKLGAQVETRIERNQELGIILDLLIAPWIQYQDFSQGIGNNFITQFIVI